MASFPVSYRFAQLLASEGLTVTGLEETPSPMGSLIQNALLRAGLGIPQRCRLVLPIGGRKAKSVFHKLFFAAYDRMHGSCHCCHNGHIIRRGDDEARKNIRRLLGVVG